MYGAPLLMRKSFKGKGKPGFKGKKSGFKGGDQQVKFSVN